MAGLSDIGTTFLNLVTTVTGIGASLKTGVADLATVNTRLASLITSVNAIETTLTAGVIVQPIPAVYTVAGLPVTAASGQWAFASNGRKPSEGGGAGTGVPVFFNTATGTWFSYCSGAVVAA